MATILNSAENATDVDLDEAHRDSRQQIAKYLRYSQANVVVMLNPHFEAANISETVVV